MCQCQYDSFFHFIAMLSHNIRHWSCGGGDCEMLCILCMFCTSSVTFTTNDIAQTKRLGELGRYAHSTHLVFYTYVHRECFLQIQLESNSVCFFRCPVHSTIACVHTKQQQTFQIFWSVANVLFSDVLFISALIRTEHLNLTIVYSFIRMQKFHALEWRSIALKIALKSVYWPHEGI